MLLSIIASISHGQLVGWPFFIELLAPAFIVRMLSINGESGS